MISFDHDIFSIQRYGGISRYFSELCIHLTELGADYRVVSGISQNQYLKNSKYIKNIGIPVNRYPRGTGRFFQKLNEAALVGISHFQPYDINHATYYHVRNTKKTKNVITVYDFIHEKYPNQFQDSTKIINLKKSAIEKADGIICISNHTQDDLREMYNVSDKLVETIHLGVNKVQTVDKRTGSKVGMYGKFLLYVGDRHGYKNFQCLLDAYRMLLEFVPNVNLVCFGGGIFSEAEVKSIGTLNTAFKQNVYQMSGNDTLLNSLYRTAVCLVYPSLYEGFGLPPLEAINQLCPVIVADSSSIPEVVGSLGTYFDPQSSEDLLAKLHEKCQHPLLNIPNQSAIDHLKCFNMQNCAKQTLKFYYTL